MHRSESGTKFNVAAAETRHHDLLQPVEIAACVLSGDGKRRRSA